MYIKTIGLFHIVVRKESDEYHFFLGALIRRNKALNAGSQPASTRR